MGKFKVLIALMSTAFFLTNPVFADKGGNPNKGGNQGKGKGVTAAHGNQGKGQGSSHVKSNAAQAKNPAHKNIHDTSAKRFSKGDKTIIEDYFNKKTFPVKTLPPGIAMNLERGKPLPPGIEKVFLPNDLASQLTKTKDYQYLIAGRDVLLVDPKTNIVDDILPNILKP